MFSDLPLTALRAFEAAARLHSFKAAGEELAVTSTAISQQIKILEQHLGMVLFERHSHGVRLTEAGEQLFGGLHNAFLDIASSINSLQPQLSRSGLLVTTIHSFAALWLIPRLGRFYEAHPDINVRLDTSHAVVDLQREAGVDVAIRYGQRDYPDLIAACRLVESFGVYAAPGLLNRRKGKPPALITVHWRDSTLYEKGWREWCAKAGVNWMNEKVPARIYTEEYYALQAAIAGQGFLLGSSILVSDSVQKELLMPYKPEICVPGAAYTALCAPGRERHTPVRIFLDWLEEEFQSEM